MRVQYLDYIIDAYDTNDSFFKTIVKLSARVSLDKKALYNFLHKNSIVTDDWDTVVRRIQYAQSVRNTYSKLSFFFGEQAFYRDSKLSEKDVLLLNAFSEFVEKNQHTFYASARMYLDFSLNGRQPLTERRALDKIMVQVKALPKPRYALIQYLKDKGLIDMNKEVNCEILNKDI